MISTNYWSTATTTNVEYSNKEFVWHTREIGSSDHESLMLTLRDCGHHGGHCLGTWIRRPVKSLLIDVVGSARQCAHICCQLSSSFSGSCCLGKCQALLQRPCSWHKGIQHRAVALVSTAVELDALNSSTESCWHFFGERTIRRKLSSSSSQCNLVEA